jgi:hypothetical protein
MEAECEFDLRYSRPILPIMRRVNNKTDESFQRLQQHRREQNEANSRLNNKSKEVGEEIHKGLWASMYQQYLITRINDTREAKIAFSVVFAEDMPDITHLSVNDNEDASSSTNGDLSSTSMHAFVTPFDPLSTDLQLDILEQRKRDARISTKATLDNVNSLIDVLTLGKTTLFPL